VIVISGRWLAILAMFSRGFHQSFKANAALVHYNKSRPLPFEILFNLSFTIILLFDAT
jgi:hypothetical protein